MERVEEKEGGRTTARRELIEFKALLEEASRRLKRIGEYERRKRMARG